MNRTIAPERAAGATPAPAATRTAAGRTLLALALLGAAVALGGCGASSTAGASPEPAGRTPSPIARMICEPKAAHEIATAIGSAATVEPPTWIDHDYSCAYAYRTGTMVLSVKELSSWAATKEYFSSVEHPGTWRPLYRLGQQAAQGPDGTIVVRKDWKVLVVDVRGLPRELGSPPATPSEAALTVAGAILECWHGD